MDFVILKTAFFVFFIFILLHLLILSFFKEEQVRQTSLVLLLIGIDYCIWDVRQYGLSVVLVSCFIFSLSVLVYMVYVHQFLYDPTVESKLINLLNSKEGKSFDEITSGLSADKVLRDAIKRLVSSKKVCYDSSTQTYSLAPKTKNIFLLSSIKQGLQGLLNTAKN